MSGNQDFTDAELDLLLGLPRRAPARVRDLLGPVAARYFRVGTGVQPAHAGQHGTLAPFQPRRARPRHARPERLGPGCLHGRTAVLGWQADRPVPAPGEVFRRGDRIDRYDLTGPEPVMAAPVRTVTPEDRAHLEGYSPEIAPERWEAIRPFVLPLVLDYLPHTEARIWPILRHLVAYVDWCHHGHDVALDRERLLDPDMIAYYIANVTGISKSSKTTRRALLLRVCDFLVPDMRRTVRMQPIGKEPASQPYTPAELKQLRMLAMEQPTPYLRHSAWVLLAFGLGAGLTAGEIAEVRREDVVEDRKGVYVVVRHSKRNQLRRVPVLDEFADEAIVLARCVLPGSWVFRSSRTTAGPGTVAAWASRLRTPEGVSFNLTRMRSTWIVRHLNAGVPVTAVLAAAGMGTFTGLDRYTPYLTQLSADEVRELVGRETNARAAASGARAMTHPGKREAKRRAERDYYARNRERVRARQREHYAERKRAQFEGLVS